jgi:hypothetical protein
MKVKAAPNTGLEPLDVEACRSTFLHTACIAFPSFTSSAP